MGQISLPRLEKINVSMKWEGGLLLSQDRWLNPQISLLSYYLTTSLFLFKNPIFYKTSKHFYKKNSFLKSNKIKLLNEKIYDKRTVMKSYTFQQFNNFKGILIISKTDRKLFYKKKYKSWYPQDKTVLRNKNI